MTLLERVDRTVLKKPPDVRLTSRSCSYPGCNDRGDPMCQRHYGHIVRRVQEAASEALRDYRWF